jgi:threonine dehydrogenase-like Zn-dependent dehydrogenase
MRATVMYKAHDVSDRERPGSRDQRSTDAIIRVVRACICGSDLWPYNDGPNVSGQQMGHEAIGVIEEVGSDVHKVKPGQVVVMPFAYSDGTCIFCEDRLQTSCLHGGLFGQGGETGGAQAEALRIPEADGTLYPLPVNEDDAFMPSLLTLADVMGTGYHA